MPNVTPPPDGFPSSHPTRNRRDATANCTASACGLRPDGHPTWTRGGWKVFLDTPEDARRTIRYIENNPVPLRLPPQHWPCTTPYNNWPHHNTAR